MRGERFLIIIVDGVMIYAVSLCVLWLRYMIGPWEFMQRLWLTSGAGAGTAPTFAFIVHHYLEPMVVIAIYWILLFAFYGLYTAWKATSRLDEMISIGKISAFGSLILFLPHQISPFDLAPPSLSKLIVYWCILVGFVSTGRMAVRTFQRHLLIRGIGRHPTFIVGGNERGRKLLTDIQAYPASIHEVVGFVGARREELQEATIEGIPVVGSVEELPDLIQRHQVDYVLIATPSESREAVLDIVAKCNGEVVQFSIVPDLYDIVSGHIKTNELYGVPLVELVPELMPVWERTIKRLLDIIVSLVVLIGAAPLWFLIALLIRLDSSGSIFFYQERVGKNGKLFTIYKFRSMIEDAERETGPVWAEKDDSRVTRVGRVIRRLRFDEIPQFLNILDGEMSLVGPRPERPFFVEQFKRQISLYARRLSVKPGLTGWAQTKHTYDQSLDDVREKLKYDLYYIENMSLRMDLKILIRTIWVVLSGKGAH